MSEKTTTQRLQEDLDETTGLMVTVKREDLERLIRMYEAQLNRNVTKRITKIKE